MIFTLNSQTLYHIMAVDIIPARMRIKIHKIKEKRTNERHF